MPRTPILSTHYGFKNNPLDDPKSLAADFIDAAPEDATSVDDYDWSFRHLTHQELLDTGLCDNDTEHAQNIGLNPALSDLNRTIVVSLGDDEFNPVAVWDGVHRIMSANQLGHTTLPAAVGIKKKHRP